MNERISLRLDLLRWAGAGLVFVNHFSFLAYTGLPQSELTDLTRPLGMLGVAIFFVLSGYVIAHVAEAKHPDLRDFLRARLARLYSVYIPALLLTAIFDCVGRAHAPDLYQQFPAPGADAKTFLRATAFVLFLQENSFFSTRWFSNGPMWSLAYEFWYYVLFGLAFYLRGMIRVLAVLIVAFVAGWKILLLFPIWLTGVAIYRHRARFSALSRTTRSGLMAICLALVVLLCVPYTFGELEPILRVGFTLLPPGYHSWFIFYYFALPALAGTVACCIQENDASSLGIAGRVIRFAAGFSFSLYLLHVPAILCLRSLGIFDSNSVIQVTLFGFVIIATIYAISLLTEHRKRAWLRLISKIV